MAIKKTVQVVEAAVKGSKKGKIAEQPKGKKPVIVDEVDDTEEHEARVQEKNRALKIVWNNADKEPANIREAIAAKELDVSERFVNSAIRWARRFKLFVE